MSHTTKWEHSTDTYTQSLKRERRLDLRNADKFDAEDGFNEHLVLSDQGGPINTGQLVFPTTFRLGTA